MSYQVLARKWRPRLFQELVGQEHVVRALINALDNDRLHHAFLFTGTRGVGKTTIARILAKSLNCEQGISSKPCGVCTICREIDEGRFVDLIEVDAASRTGVDDTRELLENVQYAPARGRYKVYLIDEVHMFSKSSFNALLKTLEEPPPHVKFLLATTDPQKLPVTILSRCLQFNLKRLPVSLITERLDTILQKEAIEREVPALTLLARAGDGSMRDALSLLDQAIAFGGGRVKLDDVHAMLGTIDQRYVLDLLDALATGDGKNLFDHIARLDPLGPDYGHVLAELISLLQRIALVQAIPTAIDDAALSYPQEIRRLAEAMKPEDVQLFYQIALLGRRDLSLSPEPRDGFEMILLRMLCFRPASAENDASLQHSMGQSVAVAKAAASVTGESSTGEIAAPKEKDLQSSTATAKDWNAVVASLGLKGMAQQLALNCAMQGREENTLRLILASSHAHLRTKNAEERLRVALQDYYGEPLHLHIQTGEPDAVTPALELARSQTEQRKAAVEVINGDPNIQALRETFDAQLKPDSITPID